MQPVQDTNTRYILELEREKLLEEREEVDARYGVYTFAFLTSIEALSLLTYMVIFFSLTLNKRLRSKTNVIIATWAILNAVVLLRNLAANLFQAENTQVSNVIQMLAALSRSYATSLYIVWFYTKFYKGDPYKSISYLLMFLPAMICTSYILYNVIVDEFIYEVYGPGSDILNWTVYFVVTALYICGKISEERNYKCPPLALLVALVGLVTSLPMSLMTIYLRFVLDIGWVYRFHSLFVDLVISLAYCSASFIVLLAVILTKNKVANVKLRRNSKEIFVTENARPVILASRDLDDNSDKFLNV